MKRSVSFLIGLLVIIGLPIQAAINVRLQGQIYSEISSRPGDELRAGNRIKLFSELAKVGPTTVKVRMWYLNQKANHLNRYDISSNLKLDDIIDWAEVRLSGNLYPQGPKLSLALGNVEVNYSPYIISIVDEGFNDYIFSYRHHQGIALQDIKLLESECSGFILWGFGDPNKNAIGGQVSKKFKNMKLTGIIVDYRYRAPNAKALIHQAFNKDINIMSELEWQQVRSVDINQELGKVGTFRFFIASQDQNVFEKVNNQVIQNHNISFLKEIEWNWPIDKDVKCKIGYRNYPSSFDPLLRDRTPEFDTSTGYYLGYNPLDKYKGLRGAYLSVSGQKESIEFNALIENMKDDKILLSQYNNTVLTLRSKIGKFDFDIYSSFGSEYKWLETGTSNILTSNFTRTIISYPVSVGDVVVSPGLELRRQKYVGKTGKRGTLFLNCKKNKLLTLEAGVRQVVLGEATNGYYVDLRYQTLSGIVLNYRFTWPVIISDGKEHYDPDYRLLKEDNIAKLSAKIEF